MPEQGFSQLQQQKMQQVLAPQLRQSLECLQASVMELHTLVQHELEQNPALEEEKPREETPLDIEAEASEPDREEAQEFEMSEDLQALAQLNDEWSDYFRSNQVYQPYNHEADKRRQFFLDSVTEPETLEDHLRNQLVLADLKDSDRDVAELLIGNLNEDGYMSGSLEELAESRNVPLAHLERVLPAIQDMHPVGVGARNLEECLLIQIERLGLSDLYVERLIREELQALSARRYADIARRWEVVEEDIKRAAHIIATLEPKPGRMYGGGDTTYVSPEIFVTPSEEGYAVVMDDDRIPHLRISRRYMRMLEDADTPDDVKRYIRDKLQAGTFLIKSIQQRQQTLYRIARHIADVQRGFMEHGVSHLKPLTMAEVASALGVHETTISRAVANKYIQTPQGVFEMKYFFTPGYRTAGGDSVSNRTIQDMIAQLTADEPLDKPLSDQALVNALKERGIQVARRTIAKYRDQMNIPPSHLRKRMA